MSRQSSVILIGVLFFALWVSLLWPRYHQPGRSRADCETAQQLWDGQNALLELVGRELTGSPVQADLEVENVREQLGPRPVC